MKEPIYILKLDKYDYGIILNTLNEKRNALIQENKDTDMIDTTLIKVIDSQEKKRSEREER